MLEASVLDVVSLVTGCLWFIMCIGTILFTLWFITRLVTDIERGKGEKK